MLKNGNAIFIFLLGLWLLAEIGDRSPEPVILVLANLYEFVLAVAGVWKLIEFFWEKK